MSTTLTIEEKQVPVLLDCDVLVVGAGMSGFAAAVSASRAGVAAAEAAKQNVPVNAVDISAVQPELRRQKDVLDM
jgi:thioredoxin reductase